MQDSIKQIENWFEVAKPDPKPSDVFVQAGCHFEEFAEMLVPFGGGDSGLHKDLVNMADWLKEGGKYVENDDMTFEDDIELLDSLCDQIVTAVGLGKLKGFDMVGALQEVIRSNNSKMVDGKFIYDDNGKISKPESYSEPQLAQYAGGKKC